MSTPNDIHSFLAERGSMTANEITSGLTHSAEVTKSELVSLVDQGRVFKIDRHYIAISKCHKLIEGPWTSNKTVV